VTCVVQCASIGKARYIVTFVDDYSRWCEIRLLKRKDKVLTAFKDFKAMAERLHGRKIIFLQTDNGKEYINATFDDFLRENGIRRRLTITHMPEQNGVAERMNRTLLDMTRCLLIESQLPTSFWGEANYLRNRCPSKSLGGKTPYEKWTGSVPDISHLQPFGTEVYTLDRDPTKGKLDPRSRKGVLVGYSDESKGYRVWLTEEKKIDITRDVKFVLDATKQSETMPHIDDLIHEDNKDEEKQIDEIIIPPPSTREYTDHRRECDEDTVADDSNRDDVEDEKASNLNQEDDEDDIVEVIRDQDQQRRGRGRPRIIRTEENVDDEGRNTMQQPL